MTSSRGELTRESGTTAAGHIASRRSDPHPVEAPVVESAERGDRFWRDARRRRMLAIADVGAGLVATLLVAGSTARVMWALALLPGWVVLAKLLGLYDRDQRAVRHLTVDELPSIAGWAAV